jgi:predicted transcriptional regulator
MGMGIVSDKDFDKELTNVDIKPVSDNKAHIHILDKPGRKPNDVNVPDTLRKTIASTAIEHGREAAIDLASQFGISPSSVSAYTQGARSTSTYNERPATHMADDAGYLGVVKIVAEIFSIGTNFSILIVGIKLVRYLAQIEFKVDMMWGVFQRRFGTRTERSAKE